MPDPPALTIGELAARSGVAPSALRFYEQKNLIHSARTAGGQRRYPRAMLRRVALIRTGQRVGLSLAELADALATLPTDRVPTQADWVRLSRAWRTQLEERITLLTALRDDLSSCIGCGCLSLRTCRLHNPDDEAAADGPGPRRFRSHPVSRTEHGDTA